MYEKHPLNVWPDADADDYAGILGSIRERGYDDSMPVVLYEGKVLDGWQRCRACNELGMEPETRVFEGDDDDALAYAAATNKRRNLSSWQKACAAADAVEVLARIRDSQPRGGRPRNDGKPNQKVGEVSDAHDRQTATKVAEMFGTNREYTSKAVKLRKDDPETFGMAKAGLTSYDDVRKMEKNAKHKNDVERQRKEIEDGVVVTPDGKFDVIVLDPPWNYGREYDANGSRVANPYPEMTQEQLVALPVTEQSKDSSVMFLWTTHQFIFDAKALLDAWGFAYKATMVWDKEKIGMGAWLRMQCEFCLVAVKGKPFWENTSWRDIIREARREHSRKPEVFYEMVRAVTAGRRLEYFSREAREGFEGVGNDTTKF